MWMKLRSERGREALYIGCVYMPIILTVQTFLLSIVVMRGLLKKMNLVLGRREGCLAG